ncbi:MAG: dihydroorotase, partial [Nitrospirota bacterium]
MRILIKNGHIIDPSQKIDGVGDILIEDGKIREVKSHPPQAGSEVRNQQTNPPESPHTPLWKRGAEGDFKGGRG